MRPAFSKDLEFLEKDRMVSVWVEGETLGDMIIGARGQITFVYMDQKALKWASDNRESVPEWMFWNLQHQKAVTWGKNVLFLIRYKALKNWNFDVNEIKIGKYSLKPEDIVTREEFRTLGDLPSGTEGTLALAVPMKYLKSGDTVTLSYGKWSENWTVPRR